MSTQTKQAFEEKVVIMTEVFDQMFVKMQQVSADCMAVTTGDLTKKDLMVIDFVGKESTCIMRDIAEYLNAPVSTLTSMIDKLVRKKQLRRERSEEDRRIVEVMLGDIGKQTFEEFRDSRMTMCRAMLSALEPNEQEEIIRLMGKVSKQARNITE